eukprot:SAG31_NODE_10903_length_1085_cov_1.355984_1_plen_163_part_01
MTVCDEEWIAAGKPWLSNGAPRQKKQKIGVEAEAARRAGPPPDLRKCLGEPAVPQRWYAQFTGGGVWDGTKPSYESARRRYAWATADGEKEMCRCSCGREGHRGEAHSCPLLGGRSKKFTLSMRLVVPAETGPVLSTVCLCPICGKRGTYRKYHCCRPTKSTH